MKFEVCESSVRLTWYFCINSEPQTLKKVAEVWFATALASRVLPAFESDKLQYVQYKLQLFEDRSTYQFQETRTR